MKIANHIINTIVSDFDGTLLKQGAQELSEEFFPVMEQVLAQGVRFVAASGRQYPNLKRLLAPIADEIGFIAENGALVIWKGEVIHKCVIPRNLAMELIEDMKKEPDSEILVSGEGTSYVVPNNPEYAYLLEHVVKNVVSVLSDFEEVGEEMIKVSIYYPGGIPKEAERRFHAKYDGKLLVVESGNGWLDFMPKESGKGNALKILSEKMGFSLENTIAFGDSENDISMLETAGVGFAMSHARSRVKGAAQYMCDSVEAVLREAADGLYRYGNRLAERAGADTAFFEDFWKRLSVSVGVMREFAYYCDHGEFLGEYQVEGYSLVDILVWQVDHFKAYLDRPDEMNRYRKEKLILESFDTMLKMEQNAAPYVEKMRQETGTDYVGKV